MDDVQVRENTEDVRARVRPHLHATLKAIAAADGLSMTEVVSRLLEKALMQNSGKPPEAVLEAEFCKMLGSGDGDPSDVAQIVDTAKFRGISTLECVLRHVRWGIRNGNVYE